MSQTCFESDFDLNCSKVYDKISMKKFTYVDISIFARWFFKFCWFFIFIYYDTLWQSHIVYKVVDEI